MPRAVTFGEQALTVHRRLLPDTQVRYGDITGFGLGRLLSRTGRFGWAQFENAHEVDDAFDALIRSGTIPADQLSARPLESDLIGLSASVYGFYALLGLGGLGLVLSVAGVPIPAWMWSGPDWLYEVVLPIGTYLVATGIAYLVLRHRARRDHPE